MKHCPDALRVQKRAIANLPENARAAQLIRPYTQTLARYAQACGANDPNPSNDLRR